MDQQSRLEGMEGERRLCSGHNLVRLVIVAGLDLSVEPYVARKNHMCAWIDMKDGRDGSEASKDAWARDQIPAAAASFGSTRELNSNCILASGYLLATKVRVNMKRICAHFSNNQSYNKLGA